MYGDMIS